MLIDAVSSLILGNKFECRLLTYFINTLDIVGIISHQCFDMDEEFRLNSVCGLESLAVKEHSGLLAFA